MDRNGFIAIVCIVVFISTNCNASLSFHRRELIDSEQNNASTTPKVLPTKSPVNETKTNPINTEKPQQDKPTETETQVGSQTNSNLTLPVDQKVSSKNENDTKIVGPPNPPADDKNGSTVPVVNEKANVTTPNLGKIDSCEGSMVSCTEREMLVCIHTTYDGGSKGLLLVVKNEGEVTLKVNVQVPNDLINDLPAFEVPKHKTNTVDISSTMGKTTELIVNSGDAKCVLPLVKSSASAKNIIHQLSFYSKQVTPIHGVYASFIVALLLGGTWACCWFSKRNQQDGIPYQENEMGLPESSSAVNVDEEGWDDNWDDDWDEDNDVKSPSGHQVSVSSSGLVSRSASFVSRPSKKDGWENDWDD